MQTSNNILYPASVGMEVVINNKRLPNDGLKEGVGETGMIIDFYDFKGQELFIIDMGLGLELHFTRDHFDIVEEP